MFFFYHLFTKINFLCINHEIRFFLFISFPFLLRSFFRKKQMCIERENEKYECDILENYVCLWNMCVNEKEYKRQENQDRRPMHVHIFIQTYRGSKPPYLVGEVGIFYNHLQTLYYLYLSFLFLLLRIMTLIDVEEKVYLIIEMIYDKWKNSWIMKNWIRWRIKG